MKKLSLIEFQRLCSQFGPSLYIFNSENQPDCKINIKVEQKYTDIIVKLDPGRICLKSESGYIMFYRVKSVVFHDDMDFDWRVFDFVCGSQYDYNLDETYTILVDKI